ncbi:MAG: sulfotransferase [Hydrogenovibrio sp.]|uniref:sulfotransferase family protein n=1 Tax=Hydrogenovibrio sp. TaxID=2065821 RepID=UPI002870848C|nr:sulfotransferase [Hydrogenovibrio sp.]MDR9498522.1 sulfotransferase [Hydrogenovibrio sp.]MDR9499248.1 sulfotransferase [Hydrogenovibrio sp.]
MMNFKLIFKYLMNGGVLLLIRLLSPPFNLVTFNKFKGDVNHWAPIFIIGAPRTGSTILYQALTNQSDVVYIDNLSCFFKQNLFMGEWFSNKLFKQKAHNCFQSDHGNTKRCGWRAPSECGVFWYRWLPTDRHFVDHNEVSQKDIEQIRSEVTASTNYFNKPIVFKNLNAGQRLRMLVKAFPDAKFVFVRRDPLYTAQSILKAKRKLKIPGNQFWSIMPSNVEDLKQLEWPEQIVKQIYYLEKQIAEDLQLFPKENVFEVKYTDLSQQTISGLVEKLDLKQRDQFQNPVIKLSEEISLPEQEVQLLQNEIKKLDWSTTHVK